MNFDLPELVMQAIKPYYPEPESKPRILFWTLVRKQTHHFKKYIPYLFMATQQHVILFSFNRDKKQKKISKQMQAVKIHLRSACSLDPQSDIIVHMVVTGAQPTDYMLLFNSKDEVTKLLTYFQTSIAPDYRICVYQYNKQHGVISDLRDFETLLLDFSGAHTTARYHSVLGHHGMFKSKQQLARRAVQRLFSRLNGFEDQEQDGPAGFDVPRYCLRIDLSRLLGIAA